MRIANWFREKKDYFIAAISVITSTAIFMLGRSYIAKEQWAILYLLIIVFIAAINGVRSAVIAAILSFLCWNYFLIPPYHTFRVHDPQDWLALIAFLVVGVLVGVQTGRMKEREAHAWERERQMELLNKFSARLVSDATISDIIKMLIDEVRSVTQALKVVLFIPGKSDIPRHYQSSDELDNELLIRITKTVKQMLTNNASNDSDNPKALKQKDYGFEIFIPLNSTTKKEGVLYIGNKKDNSVYNFKDFQLIAAMANQAAAFLERKHLQTIAVQADALREADKLKTTFVSSVSHELKTPLASITATISNLLEQDIKWDKKHFKMELSAVQKDLNRLNKSIGALLDLSRLESSAWEPKKDWYELGEMLASYLSNIPNREHKRLSFDLAENLPAIYVDYMQWVRVMQNLIENALIYSPIDSIVTVSAKKSDDNIIISVQDNGPGIIDEDKNFIFDKFYRGKAASKVPSGTGLGLAITKELVKFHSGKIWIEDVKPHGTRILISLPIKENQ